MHSKWHEFTHQQGARYFALGTNGAGRDKCVDIVQHVGPPVFTMEQLLCSVSARVSCGGGGVCPCN